MPNDATDRGTLILALARARGWKVPSPGTGSTPSEVLGERWSGASADERASFEQELASLARDPAAVARLVGEPDIPGSIAISNSAAFAQTVRPGAAAGAASPHPGPLAESGRYRVRREHARGGMGRVLVVADREIGRDVAMKELLPHLAQGFPLDRERFLREARITGQLEHPNIVPVYEIGTSGGETAYYTMKLVRGETMEARLGRLQANGRMDGRRKLAERLKLLDPFIDVCNAVAYAHSRGVVNRDLKPANVMLGDFGETVVLDWGLARKLAEEEPEKRITRVPRVPGSPGASGDTTRLTMDGDIMGTPAYMSPEQARGEIAQVDERSDIFSLGAMLFEIVTGVPPHRKDSLADMVRAILEDPTPDAAAVEPLAPRELSAVASAAMEKDRSRRLDSAKKLAEEVRAWRDGRPMALYRHSATEQLGRFVRHNRALALALGGGLLAILAGAAVSLAYARDAAEQAGAARAALQKAEWQTEEARRAGLVALSEKRIAQGQRLAAYSTNLAAENPTAALLVAMEAARRAPGSASTNALWNTLSQLVEHRRFIGHESNAVDARFSPDGSLVATASFDFTTRIWDVATGRQVRRLDAHQSAVARSEWSDDGRFLLTVPAHPGADALNIFQPEGTLDVAPRVWDTKSWECVRVLRGHRGALRTAHWAPGGRVLSLSEDRTVRLWDGEGKAVVFEVPWVPLKAAASPDGRWIAAVSGPNLRLWRTDAPDAPVDATAHGRGVWDLAWSPDSSALFTCGEDGAVARRDPATLRVLAEFRPKSPDGKGGSAPAAMAHAVLAHPDGARLAVVASGWLHVISSDFSREFSNVRYQSAHLPADRLDADWKRVLLITETTALVRDVETGADLAQLRGHEYLIEAASMSRDGRRAVTGGRDALVIVWNTSPGACLPTFRWSAGRKDVAVSTDATRVLTLAPENKLELRDNATGDLINSWQLPGPTDGFRFIGGSKRFYYRPLGTVILKIFDPEKGWLFDADAGAKDLSWSLPSANGDWLYLAAKGRSGRLWNVATGEGSVTYPWMGFTYELGAIADDGKFILAARSAEAKFVLFDRSGRELGALEGHNGWTIGAAFAGDRVLTTAMDATVKSWNRETRELLGTGRWPLVQETYIGVSPTGDVFVLTGGGTARFYRTDTLDEIASLPRGLTPPAGFTPDGKFVAVYRDGDYLHLPMDALAYAERVAPRELTVLEFKGMADTRAEGDAYGQDWARRHPRQMSARAKAKRAVTEKNWDEALRQCVEAQRLLPGNPLAFSLEAEIRAAMATDLNEGDPERVKAIEAGVVALEQAVERGYRDVKTLAEDPGLAPLRSHPRWTALLEAAQRKPWEKP